VRLAVRHRLGLLPYDSLARQSCQCRFHTPFAVDPDHFHSCDKHKRTLLNQRHNNVVQVVQDLAVSAGFTAIREPNSHVRPDSVDRKRNSSVEYNHHADLLLLRHDLKLYIDVTITRPTRESLLDNAPTAVSSIPLYSTRQAAIAKHAKYNEIARVNDYQLIPFVMETYGGMGAEATKLLHIIAAHSQEYTAADFLTHAHSRLSVALQSSNADIAQNGMQLFHLRQHAANKCQFDISQQARDARNRMYSQPAHGDQLATRVSLSVHAADAAAAEAEHLGAEGESALPFTHERRVAFADTQLLPHMRRCTVAEPGDDIAVSVEAV
jgi:hypothetical protein